MKCHDCQTKIPAKRLEAIPNARYCADCQRFYDKKRPRDNSYAPAVAVGSEGDDVSRFREEGWLNG